jgi:acetyltransferase
VTEAVGKAAAAGVPLVVGPRALATAVSALAEDARRQAAASSSAMRGGSPLEVSTGPWSEDDAKRILHDAGVRTPVRRICSTRDEARRALADIGGSVVLKVSDATILHKSDIGGVRLGISDPTALDEVLVEQLVGPGVDLIVGARRDPVFGPVVLVGVGGTATEVYADVAIAAVPCPRDDLVSLADRLQARTMLDGHRGDPSVDRGALADVLGIVGDLLAHNPHLAEVEVNPLRASEAGLIALDAVLVAEPQATATKPEQPQRSTQP